MFEHNFDTFSVYTKTQIVDKQLSPPSLSNGIPVCRDVDFTLIPLDNKKKTRLPIC